MFKNPNLSMLLSKLDPTTPVIILDEAGNDVTSREDIITAEAVKLGFPDLMGRVAFFIETECDEDDEDEIVFIEIEFA